MTGDPVPPQSGLQLAAALPPADGQRSDRAGSFSSSPAFSAWWDLNRLCQRAEQRVPDWQTITLRLPAQSDPNVSFLIDSGAGGRPDKRAQLTLSRKTGADVRWEPFSAYNAGRRLRLWIRFTHTGEAAGVLGQTVAALASLGGAFLVWTGLSLALRRLGAKLARRTSASATTRTDPEAPRPFTATADEVQGSENAIT